MSPTDTEEPEQPQAQAPPGVVTMKASDFVQAPSATPEPSFVTMKASDFAQAPKADKPPQLVTMHVSDFATAPEKDRSAETAQANASLGSQLGELLPSFPTGPARDASAIRAATHWPGGQPPLPQPAPNPSQSGFEREGAGIRALTQQAPTQQGADPGPSVRDFVPDVFTQPMLPVSELLPGARKGENPLLSGLRAFTQGAESITSPAAIATMIGTAGVGSLGRVGAAIEQGLVAAFGTLAVKGAGEKAASGYEKWKANDVNGAAADWGMGTADGLFATLLARASYRGKATAVKDINEAWDAWRKGGGGEPPPPPGAPPAGGASETPPGGPPAVETPPGTHAEPATTRQKIPVIDQRTGLVTFVETETGQMDPHAGTSLLDAIIDHHDGLLDRIAAEHDAAATAHADAGADLLNRIVEGQSDGTPAETTPVAAPEAAGVTRADAASPGATGPRSGTAVPPPDQDEQSEAPGTAAPVGTTVDHSKLAEEAGGKPAESPTAKESPAKGTEPTVPNKKETTESVGPEKPSDKTDGSQESGEKTPPVTSPKTEHDYSSTQVNLPEHISTPLRVFGHFVRDAHLSEDGREDNPHITVKYGLHGNDPEAVRELLRNQGPITVTLGKSSLFPAANTESARGGGGTSDVLKVDVDSPELHKLNALIAQLPHTDTYPTYQPHATIAYLKPGEGKKYDQQEIPGVTGQKITLDSLTFSGKDGKTVEIPLTGKPASGSVEPEGAGKSAEGTPPATGKEPWEMTPAEWFDHKWGQIPKKAQTSIIAGDKGFVGVDVIRRQSDGEHRRNIERAIREGKPVPAEVLVDYPDLKAKSPTATEPAPPKKQTLPKGHPLAKGETKPAKAETKPAGGETKKPFGAIYGGTKHPAFITPEGPVWMWRKGQKVRFFTAEGVQVGPEQSNVAPAVAAAHAAGWTDVDFERWSEGDEVFRNGDLIETYRDGRLVDAVRADELPVQSDESSEPAESKGGETVATETSSKEAAPQSQAKEKPAGTTRTIEKPQETPTIKTEKSDADHAAVAQEEGSSAELPGAGSSEPSEGASSEDVPGSGEKRKAGSHRPADVGLVHGSTARPDGESEDAVRSGDGNPSRSRVPARRKGSAASGRKSQQRGPDLSKDYQLTGADHIGEGNLRAKAQANIDAIRILKQCEAEGRPATTEEQAKLAKFTGWGALSKVFESPYYVPAELKPIRAALDELLTPEEFKTAAGSTVNAHYTSPMVIGAMWEAMRHLGMEGGERVLEPSMGVGNFFGLMPEDLREGSSRTGVELDQITGGIAKLLYPGSNVHVAGVEKVPLPNDFFDVAIGNVPFGNYQVSDPEFRTGPVKSFSIHNYFFAKALKKVREGGVVAFITSSFTMDSQGEQTRKYLAEHADLLGAIRLPETAFKGNAGTEVTTDIIFLRKRAPGVPPAGEAWTKLATVKALTGRPDGTRGSQDIEINEYFASHPEMMLGKMAITGGRFKDAHTLEGTLTPEKLAKAIAKLPEGVLQPAIAAEEPEVRIPLSNLPDPSVVKDGGYVHQDGKILIRDGNELKPANLKDPQIPRVRGMLTVRDAWRNVLRKQEEGTDQEAKDARKLLNQAYDAFVQRHGPLSNRDNTRAFTADPDAPGLLALEDYDPKNKTAKKADIFRKTTNPRYVPPETAPDAASALAIALNEYGGINWARIQKLTGLDREGAERELADNGLVYRNPEGGQFETADEYLSGEVRDKLKTAIAAAQSDPDYEPNVEALKKVQPEDLGPGEIDARLGANWIPKDVIAQFLTEKLKVSRVKVGHAEAIATWNVQVGGDVSNATNAVEFGGFGWTGADLVEEAMNLKSPTVRVEGETKGSTVVDPVATAALREKQQNLKDLFRKWIWEDPARATRLAKIYNDAYNNLRLRQFDGSHLKFPGMNESVKLRDHQKNAIWRMLQGGNTLLAHVVGAGKTYAMVAAAMEMRRLGTAKKPMFVVPNHLVQQWSAEFMRLYPNANLFVASKETFSKGNRQRAMSRIANGDYDAVIVSHNSFGKLPVSDATFNAWMEGQVQELIDAIAEVAAVEGNKGPTVKDLQKAIKRLEARIEKRSKREKKDQTITFEEMGVDQLFVDESDLFKNLAFTTKMTRIAGLPNTESDRAIDMYLKTQWLTKKRAGAGVVFATGTPIANTMAEMYTVQRYLQGEQLKQSGLGHFDAWASQYGEGVTSLELAPDGSGYRMNTRFSRFVNLPELATAFRVTADVQTGDMLKLPVPKLKGGKPIIVAAEASAAQKAYIGDDKTVGSLVYRAGHLPKGPPQKGADNMLAIAGDGRKCALDMRLVHPGSLDNPDGKVNKAVDKIFGVWARTKDQRSTQLVFSDLSTPNGRGFNVYTDARDKLIARGIPASEIAFIHDYDTDVKKKALYDAVNDGRIRILFGSTEKMGAGMNVQKKLIALHHLDAPWRPRDIEQREGRILRQGNENPEVEIYRYVTAGSFDAYMWQTLEAKARFIAQVMTGNSGVRVAEDIESNALTYAEIKGIASGNPKVMEKIKVDIEVRRLDGLRSAYQNQLYKMRVDAADAPRVSAFQEKSLAESEEDQARRDNAPDELWRFGGQAFTGKDANAQAGAKLHELLEQERKEYQAHADKVAAIHQRYQAEYEEFLQDESLSDYKKQKFKKELKDKADQELSGVPEWKPRKLGTYRGFDLWTSGGARDYNWKDPDKTWLGKNYKLANISIRGTKSYFGSTNEEGNPLGTLASIRYKIDSIDQDIKAIQGVLTEQGKKLTDLKALIDRPFEHESRLAELLKQQATLNNELDLNKNLAGTEGMEQKEQEIEKEEEPEDEEEEGSPSYIADPHAPREDRGRAEKLHNRIREEENQPEPDSARTENLRGRLKKLGESFWTEERGGDKPAFSRVVAGFYSQLERVIEQKMRGPALPAQLLAMLKKPENGVKQDELKWSGLDTWLEERKGPVTKQQVLDFVKANNVQVQEVLKGQPEIEEQKPLVWRREDSGSWVADNPSGGALQILRTAAGGYHVGGIPDDFPTLEAAQEAAQEDADDFAMEQVGPPALAVKFGNYVTPGGENYRELLLTLPEKPGGAWEVFEPLVGAAVSSFATEAEAAAEARRLGGNFDYAKRGKGWEDPAVYKSGHWDEPNVLAHVRFNDRTGPDGEKILHVEEIQSDWHQAGREKGYRSSRDLEAALTPEEKELQKLNHAAAERGGRAPSLEDARQTVRQQHLERTVGQSLRDKTNKFQNTNAVPSAPFAKSWHELAFKRALRWAAENGYDQLTWTTGAQQADRYDLSKQIAQVSYNPKEQNLKAWDLGDNEVLQKRVPPEGLEDYIGKDAAKKLLDRPVDKGNGYHILRGDGLRTQAPGMVGFYDKILPAFANKYAKKWGAKVGTTEIKTQAPEVPSWTSVGTSAQRASAGGAETVHSISITPAMRESVMEGQPLFSLGRGGQAENETIHKAAAEHHAEGNYVSVNGPAQEILKALFHNKMGMPSRPWDGVTLPQSYAQRLLALVEGAGTLAHLASAIRQAVETGEPAIFVAEGSSDPAGVLREEQFHRAQMIVNGGGELLELSDRRTSALILSPGGFGIAKTLRASGYREPDLSYEIAAHAARGPAFWEEAGITPQQAHHVLELYFAAVAREHGMTIEAALRAAAPKEFNEHGTQDSPRSARPGGARTQEQSGKARGDRGTPAELPAGQPEPSGTGIGDPFQHAQADHGPGGTEADRRSGALPGEADRRKPGKGEKPGAKDKGPAYSLRQVAPQASPTATKRPPRKAATPLLDSIVDVFQSARDDIRKTINPYALGPDANTAGLSLREHAARSAQTFARAEKALEEARKLFSTRPWNQNLDFINRVETGAPQPDAALQAIADVMRGLLDSHREAVQKLGKNKLTTFYENYFPHLWNRGKEAESVFRAIFGKRPIEGTKGFLKQRKFQSFQEGVDAGLTPVSENPVDLVLLKLKEMERYTLAHTFLAEMKEIGLAKFVGATSKKRAPEGWVKIPDQIGTVWAPPFVKIPEAHDKEFMDTLLGLAGDLGMNVQRVAKLRSAWGRAFKGSNTAKTKFAGPESVILHEVGHLLDWRYDLGAQLVHNPEFKKELRDLADLRLVGNDTAYFQSYVRRGEEKIANMIAAYGHAPARFRKVAPRTFAWFRDFIKSHPELAPLSKLGYGMQQVIHTTEYPVGGFIQTGHYYMPSGAAQIISNYLSPGLGGKPWYQVLRSNSNLMLQFALGFSAFHAGFTTMDAAVSKLAIALQYLAAGKPLEAVKHTALIPTSTITNIVKGGKIRNAYLRASLEDPELSKYVEAIVQGGGRVTMDAQYRSNMRQKFLDAWRKHTVGMAALTALPALAELAVWPVLEWLVPRQKLGVFADMVDFELARLGPNATKVQVRQAFSGAWDSVDNRMGQLVYDDLFWNRTVKDLMMISVQSVGWNLGTLREFGGAAGDAGRFIKDAGRAIIHRGGGGGGTGGGSGSGRVPGPGESPEAATPKSGTPEFTRRMAYALALTILTGMMGAITDYVNTKGRKKADGSIDDGHERDWRDYFFPRTGNVDEHGKEERMALPGYLKDLVAYYMEPVTSVRNKLSPIVRVVAETTSNENFYKEKLWDGENRSIPENILVELKHLASFFVPMSVSGLLRERGRGAGAGMQAGQMLGLRTAPAYVTRTPAERYIAEYAAEHRVGASTPSVASKIEREITQALRAGRNDHALEIAEKAAKEGKIGEKELDRAIKNSMTDSLATAYNRLPLGPAIEAVRLMNPEERKKALPLLDKKLDRDLDALPAAEQQRIVEKLTRAGILQ